MTAEVIEMKPAPLTDWRPPGWIVGDPEEPYIPEAIEDLYRQYDRKGYYTRGGKLTDKGAGMIDAQDAQDISTNRKLLRDAWNTNGVVWQLAAKLIGCEFAVDPFWNAGAVGLDSLERTLDGLTPLTDGMLTVGEARALLDAYDADTATEMADRIEMLGDVPDAFPVNWRGDIKPGEGPAAANGPHSCTSRWLSCCAAYGEEEFCAAFVPDNGDGWFQNIALSAQLVVRLGRVACGPPPGISSSSPRGASALCVWIPHSIRERVAKHNPRNERDAKMLDRMLPRATWKVLTTGEAIRVPMWTRPRAGTQYAYVQRSDVDAESTRGLVDFGFTSGADDGQ